MDDFNESLIKVHQLAEELHNALLSIVDDLIQDVSEVLDAIHEVVEKIKSNIVCGTRQKWRIPRMQRIRPLLLDKRSKVHRCRNCCYAKRP